MRSGGAEGAPAPDAGGTAPPVIPTHRRALRLLPLVLVWGLAIWPVVLWLLARSDPVLAVRLKLHLLDALAWAAIVLAAVLIVAALLFPPFPAWVRLMFERFRLNFASDRGPLLNALSELQHVETAARHLEVGRLALVRSELQLAVTHLGRAVELDDQVASAWFQLGRLLLRIGQVPGAIQAFQRADDLDPGHAFGEARLLLGRCAILAGDDAAAIRILEDHSREHGGSKKSHYWLGQARAATGDREGAREAMRYAAEPPQGRLTPEENWFRALARVWLWRGGGR